MTTISLQRAGFTQDTGFPFNCNVISILKKLSRPIIMPRKGNCQAIVGNQVYRTNIGQGGFQRRGKSTNEKAFLLEKSGLAPKKTFGQKRVWNF